MDYLELSKRAFNLVTGQASNYVEIIRLKLKIIGFSNKRSGLLTKLGELSYKVLGEEGDVGQSEEVKKLMDEVQLAESEISESEKDINRMRERAGSEREEFWSFWEASSREKQDEPQKSAPAVEDKVGGADKPAIHDAGGSAAVTMEMDREGGAIKLSSAPASGITEFSSPPGHEGEAETPDEKREEGGKASY